VKGLFEIGGVSVEERCLLLCAEARDLSSKSFLRHRRSPRGSVVPLRRFASLLSLSSTSFARSFPTWTTWYLLISFSVLLLRDIESTYGHTLLFY